MRVVGLLLLSSCSIFRSADESFDAGAKALETLNVRLNEITPLIDASMETANQATRTMQALETTAFQATATLKSVDELALYVPGVVSSIGKESEEALEGVGRNSEKVNSLIRVLTWGGGAVALTVLILLIVIIHHKLTTKKRHQKVAAKLAGSGT